MEYLACLIQKEVLEGQWNGIKTSRQGPSFSHVFFADDLVLFAKVTSSNCQAINRVLDQFCSLSGQKVNIGKSRIFLFPKTFIDHISLV